MIGIVLDREALLALLDTGVHEMRARSLDTLPPTGMDGPIAINDYRITLDKRAQAAARRMVRAAGTTEEDTP